MTLTTWLAAQTPPVTAAAFALRVGVAPSTVSRLLRGLTSPSAALARRIAEETGGAVTPNDLLLPAAPAQGGHAQAAEEAGSPAVAV